MQRHQQPLRLMRLNHKSEDEQHGEHTHRPSHPHLRPHRVRLLQGFDKGLKALDQAPGIGEGLDAFHKKALEILRSDRLARLVEAELRECGAGF